ncbi:MAG: helicase/secretion neighborhood TadE-like protein [Ilumatobacteraceae bacterium]|jgi:Flp pilus assembly protein TadG
MTSVRTDRGQAVLMMTVVVVLVALVAIGFAQAADVVLDRQQAQTAADAAALAGVHGGRAAAARLAAVNGAVLVSFQQDGAAVTVVVSRGPVRARARATDGP